MSLEYVVLPNGSLDSGSNYLLINKKADIDQRILEEHNISNIVYPGDLLCEKWSLDLLAKYGQNHFLTRYDLALYMKYIYLIKPNHYAIDKVVNAVIDRYISEQDISNVFEERGYEFIFPKKNYGFRVSVHCILINKHKKSGIRLLGWALKNRLNICKINILSELKKIILYFHRNACDIKKIISLLEKHNINKVINLDINTSSGAYFFDGELNGKKVFIKAMDYLNTISNENRINAMLEGGEKLRLKWYGIKDTDICVYEYMPMPNLSDINLDRKEFDSLNSFFKELISFLESNQVTHCDIRPENIMVKRELYDTSFFICDWGCAKKYNVEFEIRKTIIRYLYIQGLGGEFRSSENNINDIVSMYWILDSLKPEDAFWDEKYYINKIATIRWLGDFL